MEMKRILAHSFVATMFAFTAVLGGAVASAQAKAEGDTPKMVHLKDVEGMKIAPMESPGNNAYLQDVVTSNDKEKPITCGMFRMEKGAPLEYTYPYDEMKVMLEGEMDISDGHDKITVRKGDVLHFPKGSKITFSSKDYGLAFICGQRAKDGA